jgi:hypothetical protein
MSFTAIRRALWIATLASTCFAAQAQDQPPRILREPILGLRYEIAKVRFDPLPAGVLQRCPTLADDASVRTRLWIHAFARNAGRSYYIVGGYGVHSNPEPPAFPRYVPYDLGTTFFLEGDTCTVLGEPKEVFDAGASNETSSLILQRLASDAAARLARAFGGSERLRTEVRNQHVDPMRLSPELSQAFKPYLGR